MVNHIDITVSVRELPRDSEDNTAPDPELLITLLADC